MKKLYELQRALLREIDRWEGAVEERDYDTDWERVHMVSCASIGYGLAVQRGVDPVLAAAACSCHDYGRIVTGRQAGHAEAGYLPVREFLRSTGLFDEEEIRQIALAVRNHSSKELVGTPLEEIVKDADVLDFHRYGYTFYKKSQNDRLERLLAEARDSDVNTKTDRRIRDEGL